MEESVSLTFEVVAGVLPGQAMPELTRRFHLLSKERHAPNGAEIFEARQAEAIEYFKLLTNPRQMDWARIDWVYY